MNYQQPLFFAPNRVWRVYTGGWLLERFLKRAGTGDGHWPEEWLASTVAANNPHSAGLEEENRGQDARATQENRGHDAHATEGVSHILREGKPGESLIEVLAAAGAGEQILGPAHVARYGGHTAVLCKYLDSAVRLPIQCHPDVPLARKLYNSSFGKTECWQILGTRTINGEEPYILLGFRPGIKRADFAAAIAAQDIAALTGMLHRLPVQPGETYFVPPRMAHAIGPGVLMLEVQEPSDLVIKPERYCAEYRLSDRDMWGPLTPEQALDIFDYTGLERAELLERVGPTNLVIQETADLRVVELIGARHTPAFGLWRASFTGRGRLSLPTEFAVIAVDRGAGVIRWEGGSREVRTADYFLLPAALKDLEFESEGEMELLVCLPPLLGC